MMKHKLLSVVFLLMAAMPGISQKAMVPPAGGKPISNELIGIFFEDISSSADGGLFAELLQNGSFEFNTTERDGWGPGTAWRFERPGHSAGYMKPMTASPLHENNPTYMRIMAERIGHYYDYNGWTGVGLSNAGFDGISVKSGASYDFSVYVRNVGQGAKTLRVCLVAPGGRGKADEVLAETELQIIEDVWTKYEAVLQAKADCPHALLRVLLMNVGEIDIDMLSLMPQDTFRGHGLRRDLAEALQALRPKFMRFPGGCVVHGGGDGFWNTYRWKTTIGPREYRRGLKNTWGYHQSMGLGYYEYFQLCEDLSMQPVPILPCGVSCQGVNGGWGMRNQAQDACPMEEMDIWVQDALDLIEWANGDVSTKWGRIRAEQGHPKPFNLKYLGIGNEERISPEFEERFTYMYNKVREAHPEIVIIGTAGPGSHKGNPDYDNAWKLAEKIDLPIIDEHYYEKREYFYSSRQYDSYPRDRKTKVYLGEYAAKDKKLTDALAEALYLLHVERNADVVSMTSYAPLFARKGATNWNPNLIYFDNERPILTCSYYVQQMFGMSSGDYYYGTATDQSDDKYFGSSIILDTKSRHLYVKVCNATAETRTLPLDLSRFSIKPDAQIMTISGQPEDENNFDAQPIAPVTGQIRVSRKMTLDCKPYSFSLITINL